MLLVCLSRYYTTVVTILALELGSSTPASLLDFFDETELKVNE